MTKLIAFGHEKRVGKDTVTNFLIQELRLKYKGIYITKGAFADRLKRVCNDLYSWAGLMPGNYYDSPENEKLKEVKLPILEKTPREVWIELGNKLREYDPNIWVNHLLKNSKADILVISDMRYPNEADAIKNLGGFVFKIERPEISHSSDVADDALIGYTGWTDIIINDKGLIELFAKTQQLIDKHFYNYERSY